MHAPGEHLHHFHGGLKLRHNKQVACVAPLVRLPLSAQYVLMVDQHIGEAARILVQPGQSVRKGDCLACNPAIPGARIHSPTSGTIDAIESRRLTRVSPEPGPAIVITPDGQDAAALMPALSLADQSNPENLLHRIDEAGIVGLGAALFPTARKLEGAAISGIHCLIINGAECEPYIACDEMLMRESPESIVEGAILMRRVTGAKRIILAIEDQMGAVAVALDQAITAFLNGKLRVAPQNDEGLAENLFVKQVTTIYPEGGERQLIKVLTGEEVPANGLPQDLGLLVHNVASAAAVANAVLDGIPLIERIVTVSGKGISKPRNVIARIGTPIADLIQFCGGYTPNANRLVMGGPLMGFALPNDGLPITKASNCILALTAQDVAEVQPEMPCINCGECVRVCPASLLPQELYWYIRDENWDEVESLHLKACIECGCCDFVCPSHIPLVDYYRYGKAALRQNAHERERAQAAKIRFENREARQLAEKESRRLAREAKKQRLKDSREASIAAALKRAESKATRPSSSSEDCDS